jgi:hypothetical protein
LVPVNAVKQEQEVIESPSVQPEQTPEQTPEPILESTSVLISELTSEPTKLESATVVTDNDIIPLPPDPAKRVEPVKPQVQKKIVRRGLFGRRVVAQPQPRSYTACQASDRSGECSEFEKSPPKRTARIGTGRLLRSLFRPLFR